MSPAAKPARRKAWLVRWEWAGDHAAVEQPIAAVLRPQLSAGQVLRIVEALYAASLYSPDEMLALITPKAHNPYPARYGQQDGVTSADEIICGHNPWLYARHARIWPAHDGAGSIMWEYEARRAPPL